MSADQIEMTLSCSECGSNDIIGPDEMTDESIVTCNTCGAEVGTWGEIQKACFIAGKKKAEQYIQGTIGERFEDTDSTQFIKGLK